MNSNNKTKHIVLTALFSAIIFILTMVQLKAGVNQSYVHLGDAVIYLSACLLPTPYSLFAASIGAGLADFLSGAIIWIIPTIIIKPLMASMFTSKNNKILNKRNIIGAFLAGLIMIAGYYLAEGIIFNNFIIPLGNVIQNIIQTLCSLVLYFIISYTIDKGNIKERYF